MFYWGVNLNVKGEIRENERDDNRFIDIENENECIYIKGCIVLYYVVKNNYRSVCVILLEYEVLVDVCLYDFKLKVMELFLKIVYNIK